LAHRDDWHGRNASWWLYPPRTLVGSRPRRRGFTAGLGRHHPDRDGPRVSSSTRTGVEHRAGWRRGTRSAAGGVYHEVAITPIAAWIGGVRRALLRRRVGSAGDDLRARRRRGRIAGAGSG